MSSLARPDDDEQSGRGGEDVALPDDGDEALQSYQEVEGGDSTALEDAYAREEYEENQPSSTSAGYRAFNAGETYDFYVYEESASSTTYAQERGKEPLNTYGNGTALPSESTEAEASSYSVTGSNPLPSEDLDESHDSVSVAAFTDDLTVDSMRRYGGSHRKPAYVINKLKAELAQTRNLLAMTKVNDIVILKTKLRAAETDLNRIRVQNLEYKEKIEELQLRLYEVLRELDRQTEAHSHAASNRGKGQQAPATPSAPRSSTSVFDPYPEQKGVQNGVNGSMPGGYQDPVSKESADVDARQLLRKNKSKFVDGDGTSIRIPPELTEHVEAMIKKAVDNAVAADRKTIAELLNELRRAEDPSGSSSGRRRVEVADKGTNTSRGPQTSSASGTDAMVDSTTSKNVITRDSPSEIRSTEAGAERVMATFKARDIILSFFAGALFAIAGTFIATLISNLLKYNSILR